MKVLLISAYFPPETGAAANLFHDLGRNLAQKGHDVTVLTSFPSYHVVAKIDSYKGSRFMEEQLNGMKVLRVKVPRFPQYIPVGRGLWQFSVAYFFSRALKRIVKHDIALIYSPPLPLGLTGMSLLKRYGTPFILNVQDVFPQSAIDLKLLKNKTLIRVFEYLEKRIYRHAKCITVHSCDNQKHVQSAGVDAGKVAIIPNWIDTEYLKPGPKQNSFSDEHGLQNKFIVSFAGIIGYSQDIDVILNAAELIREKEEILFLIAGDGVEKKRLVLKAKNLGLNNVLFLPMQLRNVYSQILHSSDICLSTLKGVVTSSPIPSKILSIMAAGKPLIACMNLNSSASNMVEDAQCGFVLPAGDYKGFADGILRLYNSPELCDNYGSNGREYCVERFSTDVCANKYIQLFEQNI